VTVHGRLSRTCSLSDGQEGSSKMLEVIQDRRSEMPVEVHFRILIANSDASDRDSGPRLNQP
jgi:hypothetical protein